MCIVSLCKNKYLLPVLALSAVKWLLVSPCLRASFFPPDEMLMSRLQTEHRANVGPLVLNDIQGYVSLQEFWNFEAYFGLFFALPGVGGPSRLAMWLCLYPKHN